MHDRVHAQQQGVCEGAVGRDQQRLQADRRIQTGTCTGLEAAQAQQREQTFKAALDRAGLAAAAAA